MLNYDNIKARYLETVENTGTKEFKKYLFDKIEYIEDEVGKDIILMNDIEIENVLKSFRTGSETFISVVVCILRDYLQFGVNEGYNSFNWLSGVTFSDSKKYISPEIVKNKYVTYDQLREFQQQLMNPQDYILLELSFLGLSGEELIELRSLKMENVTSDFILLGNRKLEIPAESYKNIVDAYEQSDYFTCNGSTDGKIKTKHIYKNDYIVRSSGKETSEIINYQSIRIRFDRIKKYLDNQYITFRTIWMSGMFWRLGLIEKERVLVKKDYENVCKIYGYNARNVAKIARNYEKFKGSH